MEQANLLRHTHANARSVLCRTVIPSGLTKERVRDYSHSISITQRGKAFLPQYSEIIPNCLFLSDHFTGTDPQTLRHLKITHVVSILQPSHSSFERLPSITYHDILETKSSRKPVSAFEEAVNFMDTAFLDGGRVLVHCRMGVDWSASVVIAWVIRNQECSFDEARAAVRKCREVVEPSRELANGVKEWVGLENARPYFPVGRGGHRYAEFSDTSSTTSPDVDYDPRDVIDIRRYI
ncbi:protein-tyrosine phosphatase-like protein [Hysterangium stoloniferum]|nr:protein-tyrosine phosphatase-like protein [Hysterangium stoloniferum]